MDFLLEGIKRNAQVHAPWHTHHRVETGCLLMRNMKVSHLSHFYSCWKGWGTVVDIPGTLSESSSAFDSLLKFMTPLSTKGGEGVEEGGTDLETLYRSLKNLFLKWIFVYTKLFFSLKLFKSFLTFPSTIYKTSVTTTWWLSNFCFQPRLCFWAADMFIQFPPGYFHWPLKNQHFQNWAHELWPSFSTRSASF